MLMIAFRRACNCFCSFYSVESDFCTGKRSRRKKPKYTARLFQLHRTLSREWEMGENGPWGILVWGHQVIRSKDFVKLFRKAGQVLSYEQILRVDTGLAESVLKSLDDESGTLILPNLKWGRFVHFSADNVDILEETWMVEILFTPPK